ncbi:MAG: hypothetical protein QXX77_09295 [Candidatus Methanosuratincola sp.]|jgi:hydrogenase maturation factor HypF (carbamoyltransferase family)
MIEKKSANVSGEIKAESTGRIPEKGAPESAAFILDYFLSHDRERIKDFEDSFWVDIDDITDGGLI